MSKLPELLDEHREIIKEIKDTGLSGKPELKDLMARSINQLESIISETEKAQKEIAGQLKTIGNKQKLNSVYSDKPDYE